MFVESFYRDTEFTLVGLLNRQGRQLKRSDIHMWLVPVTLVCDQKDMATWISAVHQ